MVPNIEQHQDELQRLSSENVALGKKLVEQKSLLDEHKSELVRQKSENELQQEAFENRLKEINSTISQIDNEHNEKVEQLVSKVNQHYEKLQSLMNSGSQQTQSSEKIEQLSDCPNEGNFRTIGGGCYLFHDEKKDYNGAKSFCESKIAGGKSGRIIEPKTTTINKLIYENANIVLGGYFIGVIEISSEGNWVYSSSGLPATTMFYPTQPDGGSNKNCVDAGVSCGAAERWCNRSCEHLHEIICEF